MADGFNTATLGRYAGRCGPKPPGRQCNAFKGFKRMSKEELVGVAVLPDEANFLSRLPIGDRRVTTDDLDAAAEGPLGAKRKPKEEPDKPDDEEKEEAEEEEDGKEVKEGEEEFEDDEFEDDDDDDDDDDEDDDDFDNPDDDDFDDDDDDEEDFDDDE
jgi:hypothetical protein